MPVDPDEDARAAVYRAAQDRRAAAELAAATGPYGPAAARAAAAWEPIIDTDPGYDPPPVPDGHGWLQVP